MKESTARIGDGRTDGRTDTHDRTESECFPSRWPEINDATHNTNLTFNLNDATHNTNLTFNLNDVVTTPISLLA